MKSPNPQWSRFCFHRPRTLAMQLDHVSLLLPDYFCSSLPKVLWLWVSCPQNLSPSSLQSFSRSRTHPQVSWRLVAPGTLSNSPALQFSPFLLISKSTENILCIQSLSSSTPSLLTNQPQLNPHSRHLPLSSHHKQMIVFH